MFHRYVILFVAICALGLVLALVGCQAPTMGRVHVESTSAFSTRDLMREADLAFTEQRYVASELYYSRLSKRQDLLEAEKSHVFKRLAQSAVKAGHHNSGFFALSQWAALDLGANDTPEYFVLGLEIYRRLEMRGELAQLTDRLLSDVTLPWAVRSRGGVALAAMQFEDNDFTAALKTLDGFYSVAPEGRATMERAFLRQLRDAPWSADLANMVNESNRDRFPYALISFENARRKVDDKKSWPSAWKDMRRALTVANLADKSYLGDILLALERDHGQAKLSVALAVPLTGRYRTVGRKIASGMAAAQWMLANYGVEVEVKVINTDATGWTTRIAQLPPNFSLVGGPLRVNSFRELSSSGAMNGRAFFTFLPGLSDGLEGSEAWRFFPSRRDEVRALADMTVNRLGMSKLAMLLPDEQYGRKMSKLFRQEITALGASVVASQTYPPDDHPQWGKRVASLLDVPADFDKRSPLPGPKFGAVFISDGWAQAQLLIPNFFFYDASDVVFLGPDLWSRALDREGTQENYYELAVCPGAWWEASDEAQRLTQFLAVEGLGKADFWVALGYDYLHLAAGMGTLPAGWGARDVNKRLSSLRDMKFALAPFSWDALGKASQKLYLFTPSPSGKALSDPESIAAGVAQARDKRAKRLKTWNENQ